uniref:Uncharacterized protein n=1 Tax=Arundo donax TaxID=35708 RepID=A0A0A9AYQ9_ARUDO
MQSRLDTEILTCKLTLCTETTQQMTALYYWTIHAVDE